MRASALAWPDRGYGELDEGQSSNASDAIIEALARALDLDDDERVHLYELARPIPARRKRMTHAEVAVPGALALLASMPSVPALLLGRRNDVLAWNPLGHALVAGHLAFTDPDDPATRPNQMRLLFLDLHTRELHRDWANEAASAVASLRFVAGQYPDAGRSRARRARGRVVDEQSGVRAPVGEAGRAGGAANPESDPRVSRRQKPGRCRVRASRRPSGLFALRHEPSWVDHGDRVHPMATPLPRLEPTSSCSPPRLA